MILDDTSIWVDHLRVAGGPLTPLLQSDLVCTHAWVIGELACGNLTNRTQILGLLQSLPQLSAATESEVLHFMDIRQLMGLGIGYIDVHLLAAATMHSVQIWTRDKRLQLVAERLGLTYSPGNCMQFRDMPCSTQAGELLDVVKVEAKPDYVLHLEFENGETRVFDMSPYMDKRPFVKLKGSPLFFLAMVDYGTVVWPGNIDIAPETLYDRSLPA